MFRLLTTRDVAEYRRALLADPCAYCDATAQVLDHIEPRARGGRREPSNETGACSACNGAKKHHSLLGFMGWRVWRADWQRRERILLSERKVWAEL